MKFEESEFYSEIISLQKELAAAGEPFVLVKKIKSQDSKEIKYVKIEHSADWLKKFDRMCILTESTVNYMWPTLLTKLQGNDELPFKIDYSATLIKILKYYDETKGNFSNFFISILIVDIKAYINQIKNYRNDLNRAFNLSTRNKNKINHCVKTIGNYNKEHPLQDPIGLYDDLAKKLYLEKNIFKNDEELEHILLLNRLSYIQADASNYAGSQYESNEDGMDGYEESTKNYSKNYGVTAIAILRALPGFIDFLNEGFKRKVNLKKQCAENQKEKVIFLKKVVTYHYYSQIRNLCNNMELSEDRLIAMFRKRSFTDEEILNIYEKNNLRIKEFDNKKIKDPIALKKLIDDPPEIEDGVYLTMKTISLRSGKPYTYGYRVIRNFRDYLEKHAEDLADSLRLADFDSIKQLI